jgi:DNA gyrase subunit A
LTEGDNDVLLATRNGKSIRFSESDARQMGRATRGVRGITLAKGDAVIGLVVVRREGSVLTVTRSGMGKRTPVSEYRTQRRGGKGLINLRLTSRTGEVIAVKEVTDEDELMLVTRAGVINRQHASEIREIGRNTQGVRLVSWDEGEEVVDVARILADLSEVESEGGEVVAGTPGADPDHGEDVTTETADS